MSGSMERSDLAIARRDQQGIRRIDREPIPNHLLRENRIGNSLKCPDLAGQRREQFELRERGRLRDGGGLGRTEQLPFDCFRHYERASRFTRKK